MYLYKKIIPYFIFGLVFTTACATLNTIRTIKTETEKPVKPIDSEQIAQYVRMVKEEAKDYHIQPLDILEIKVYQESDLTKIVRVAQSGEITFPLIGKIDVAGLTVSETETRIAELLAKDYLVNPQVIVFVKEHRNKKVFIFGAVKNPGAYEFLFEQEITIMEALSQAGGLAKIAAANMTRIIRVDEGTEKNITVRVGDILKNGDKTQDVILKPNDIIVVPETFF